MTKGTATGAGAGGIMRCCAGCRSTPLVGVVGAPVGANFLRFVTQLLSLPSRLDMSLCMDIMMSRSRRNVA